MPKYVIVGSSAGAIGAVEAIREMDPSGSLAVLTEEPSPGYSRPMMGDYLCGKATKKKMMYRSDRFWAENRAQVHAGRKAVKIDFSERYVELDQGERITFEKLLIATGSKPFIPEIEGVDKNGVFTFIKLSDAEKAKSRIKEARKAVVIGGGLIGVCASEALTKQGLDVTIVELQDKVLSLLLDGPASEIIENAIRSKGVRIITGHSVEQITAKSDDDPRVGGVILDSGEPILCDIVVLAIGVRPRTELVDHTEIEVHTGVIVDRRMRTSVPDVYACGDVAEAYDFTSNQNRILPQWPTAYLGGRIAGYNMAGRRIEYPGGTVMSAMKYFDTPVLAAGVTNQEEGNGYEVLTTHNPGTPLYKKIVLEDGVVKGFIMVNEIEKAGIIFHLMRRGVNVEEIKGKLLSEDFGLAHLPEEERRELLAGRPL